MKKILIVGALLGILCGGVAAYADVNVEQHAETATTTEEKPTTTTIEKTTVTTEKKKEVTTTEEKPETTTEEVKVTTEEPTTTTEEVDTDEDYPDMDEFENPYDYEDDSDEKCDHVWSEKTIGYDPEQGYVWDKYCVKCGTVEYEPGTMEEFEQANDG
jgi:hypothetical protein